LTLHAFRVINCSQTFTFNCNLRHYATAAVSELEAKGDEAVTELRRLKAGSWGQGQITHWASRHVIHHVIHFSN
jgi:hypothetical protein